MTNKAENATQRSDQLEDRYHTVNSSVNSSVNSPDHSSDYDSAWKDVIEELFEPFFQFFFPDIHEAIDYHKPIQFLGQESRPIMPGNNAGKRLADVLVRVHLKDGSRRCLGIFIHIEVQGSRVPDLMKRIYIYNYRAFDKHMDDNVNIISMAVLTDTDRSFRPDEYRVNLLGFDLRMKIPIVKILDYKDREDLRKKTEHSKNPMAMVVKAQLKSHEAKKYDGKKRYTIKYELFRECFQHGYGQEKTRALIKFIDWVIRVPKELTKKLNQEVKKLEKEFKMPYITTFEKLAEERGEKRGRRQGRTEGRTEGRMEGKLEVAQELIQHGHSIESAAAMTRLSQEDIEEFLKKNETTTH